MQVTRRAKPLGLLLVALLTGSLQAHVDQHPSVHDTEVGFTKVATYQVLDIQVSGNRLVYRAYDIDGKLRDEFVIEK